MLRPKTLGKKIPFAKIVHYILERHGKEFEWLARRVNQNSLLLYCRLHRDKLTYDELDQIIKIVGDLEISKVRRETKQP